MDILKQAYDPEQFREIGHQLIDLLADYLTNAYGSDMPVLPWQTPHDLLDQISSKFSDGSLQNEADLFKEVIDKSIHLHHPGYAGHQVVPPVPITALMEMVSGLLNNSMAIYEVGPFSSVVEKIITDWLCKKFNLGSRANGLLTSGGSLGNLTALLAARQRQCKEDVNQTGNPENLAILVPQTSHYSIQRAAKIMGLGEDGIIQVPVNGRYEIIPLELLRVYSRAVKRGIQVIAVVANACSTATGSYDPLEKVADFCQSQKIWMHVDAAHGGGAIFTDKYRHLLKGIERADSIVVDFHKMLLCPALTTAVVFKDGDTSFEAFSQKADYLLNSQKKDNFYDIAQRTVECTKKMMGIKVYGLLKIYGEELFSSYVTQTYDLAAQFADSIAEHSKLQLPLVPASNIVCFRYFSSQLDNDQLNQLNQKVRIKLLEEPNYYIVQATLGDSVYLRCTLMNPFTTLKDLQLLLEKIVGLAEDGKGE